MTSFPTEKRAYWLQTLKRQCDNHSSSSKTFPLRLSTQKESQKKPKDFRRTEIAAPHGSPRTYDGNFDERVFAQTAPPVLVTFWAPNCSVRRFPIAYRASGDILSTKFGDLPLTVLGGRSLALLCVDGTPGNYGGGPGGPPGMSLTVVTRFLANRWREQPFPRRWSTNP